MYINLTVLIIYLNAHIVAHFLTLFKGAFEDVSLDHQKFRFEHLSYCINVLVHHNLSRHKCSCYKDNYLNVD